MLKVFRWAAIATIIALVVGIGWSTFGNTQVSEAAQLDQGMTMVRHQTAGMSAALVDTGNFVEEIEVAKVTQIDDLINLWEPHYAASNTAYARFDAAIGLAEQQAGDYFIAKRALAQLYHDPKRQMEAQRRDDEEYALFVAWQDRANQARENARAIMRRFDDMDTDLRRLELTSGFTFDAGLFSTVPTEISDLNDKLADFQIASENIQDMTKSPFAMEAQ